MQRRWAVQLVIVLLMTSASWTNADSGQFARHQLLRVNPANERQVFLLNSLHKDPPNDLQVYSLHPMHERRWTGGVHCFTDDYTVEFKGHVTRCGDVLARKDHHFIVSFCAHLDFWSEPASFGETIYVRVDPEQADRLKKILKSASIPYDVIVDDLQRLIDEHSKLIVKSRSMVDLNIYDTYLTYEEMMSWLEDTAELCGSSRCTVVDIGRSSEGRRLVAIKITGNPSSSGAAKPAVWIDAGIHAREWISHSTALYFIDRLVVDYNFEEPVRSLLDQYDFYIMPCVNPDGYQFSHDTNRLWRKTRSVVAGSDCRGSDANRNFDFNWSSSGSSSDPCSDIYHGPRAFSEPETRALADFITHHNATWEVFLTLHSYGQMWMAPFGYTHRKPANYRALMTVGNTAKDALSRVYGTQYTVGSASDVLYRSSGTSRDWAAGVARIPFVYTVELRDRGTHGFLLPPDQILPTGVETWEAVKAMMNAI